MHAGVNYTFLVVTYNACVGGTDSMQSQSDTATITKIFIYKCS